MNWRNIFWIFLAIAIVSSSSSESEESDDESGSDDENNELPAHEFKFKERICKKGPNAGQKREMVSLVIPPWVFSKKSGPTEDSDIAYFRCNACRPKNVLAQAVRLVCGLIFI